MTRVWVLGSFPTPAGVIAAARELRRLGHADIDAYSPFPLEEIDEALGLSPSRLPKVVALGGFSGATLGYVLQWYCDAVSFPLWVGGRPPHSPPSFVPISFELTILFGALGAFLGLFIALGLPRLHHPVFEAPGFVRATVDRYWLSAIAKGASEQSDLADTLASLGASEIAIIPEEAP